MTKLRERLNAEEVFSQLDLKNGYHVVVMIEEDVESPAFGTRFRLSHWRVMVFVLYNVPAMFQLMVENIFHEVADNGVIV